MNEMQSETKYLQSLAQQADRILRSELKESRVSYIFAEARIYDARTVGVKGDNRAYGYVAEITLRRKHGFVWQKKFLENLSLRITNEIDGINRVVYVTSRPHKH